MPVIVMVRPRAHGGGGVRSPYEAPIIEAKLNTFGTDTHSRISSDGELWVVEIPRPRWLMMLVRMRPVEAGMVSTNPESVRTVRPCTR
jgi:hypothetical protein